MPLSAFGITDIGSTRSSNEDAFGNSPELHLFTVADGMGGHAAGEVASKMAVEAIQEYMASTENEPDITLPFSIPGNLPLVAKRLVAAGKLANQKIYQLGQKEQKYAGMGTTVVSLLVDGSTAYVVHAGDSRAYLIRENTIRQITNDHSLVKDYVRQGILREEDTLAHPLKHVITRALGTNPQVEMDVNTVPLNDGDLFLLCSDGLSNPLTDRDLIDSVLNSRPDLEEKSRNLVELAMKKGADDNITVILVRFSK
jgi:serine/threonine protein phosphatase PrpC